MTYDEMLTILASQNQLEQEAKQRMIELRTQLETSGEYQRLFLQAMTARVNAEAIGQSIREQALKDYQTTGSKRPHPAIGVRMTTKIGYIDSIARGWAFQHLPQALKLDTALFEKHAKAVADTDPIPFVEISQQAQITIATDLSGYLVAPAPAEAVLAGGE
jgi:hypothetical protein